MSTLVTRRASASPSSALHTTVDARHFPLRSISDVVNYFQRSLEQYATQGIEPDLTILSIIAGYVECSLTSIASSTISSSSSSSSNVSGNTATATASNSGGGGGDVVMDKTIPFPVITHDLVAGLYKKFQTIMSVVEKPKSVHNRQATREIIKKVSDVIWHSLIRSSNKDRTHLQNLYSYLAGHKLDSFGVALAVVAGCQFLGYRDVHLAISEDHAWVVFGNKRLETIEVTWHGKGSEDKRGQDITPGIESGSWLYLGGLAVVCDRPMEVAAIVSAINFSLTANTDCLEVANMQQKLLWLLYDMGHLKKYPMALGTLGELEEINPTHKIISCEQLYREAIQSARDHYRNHHVYPYTYQGNYFNRLLKYREAFAAWANAGDVIRLYTYSCRDDEEIYKELLDIANEMIPFVMKTESSGHSARSILRDSEVFANLLRFYDGICQWEEDSLTPILHIGWAKPLVNNITKFDYDIRSQVVIKVPDDDIKPKDQEASVNISNDDDGKALRNDSKMKQLEGNNNNIMEKDDKNSNDLKKLKEIPTTLADLTAACGEKILNPDFLLQGGNKPFAEQKLQIIKNQENKSSGKNSCSIKEESNGTDKKHPIQPEDEISSKQNLINTNQMDVTMMEPDKSSNQSKDNETIRSAPSVVQKEIEEEPFEFVLKRPVITLYSQKMKGLKDLLLAEKLNTHAISLQVTAQSVASSKKVRGTDKMGNHTINSTYATANFIAAAAAAAAAATSHCHNSSGGSHSASTATAAATAAPAQDNSSANSAIIPANDSIAASRPKRTRRE